MNGVHHPNYAVMYLLTTMLFYAILLVLLQERNASEVCSTLHSHGSLTPSHTSSCSSSNTSSHSPNHAYPDTEPEVDNVVETKFDPISICNMPREDSDGNGEDDDNIESFEESDGPCRCSSALKLNTNQCSGKTTCEKEVWVYSWIIYLYRTSITSINLSIKKTQLICTEWASIIYPHVEISPSL